MNLVGAIQCPMHDRRMPWVSQRTPDAGRGRPDALPDFGYNWSVATAKLFLVSSLAT